LGYDYSINRCTNGSISNDCRLDSKPIRWDYLENPNRKKLHDVTSALLHLKTTYPTFSTENFTFNDGNLLVKTVHLNHPEMDAVTLVNFRVINSEVNPKFQYAGTWYEYFTGDSISVTDPQARITFGPGEYRIYTSKRIIPPMGFITGTQDPYVQPIGLYPNVVSDQTCIHGQLPSETTVEKIYLMDMTGAEHQITFDQDLSGGFRLQLPSGFPSGMYTISILTAAEYFVGKVVKQ
jgi:hypothetical protein